MVWLEDPLCGDVAHRGVLEEQDEEAAQELAAQYTAAPDVQWTSGAATKELTVVFFVGQAACLLTGPFFQKTQAVGSISVPELVRVKSPMEEEYGSTHKPSHTCTISSTSGGSSSSSSNGLLLVECPRELPQEQAAAWAMTVLGALQPRAALIAATLPAQHYRGPGSPADEDLVFGLQTAAAAAAAGDGVALPPPLPEATLVGGLAAALLAGCELRQLPAALVVGVQMQQVPDAQSLYTLGQAVRGALGGVAAAAGGGGEAAVAAAAATGALARQQSRAQLLAALGAAADAIYRSSASSSIFS